MTSAQVAEAKKLAGHERTGCAGVIVEAKRSDCVQIYVAAQRAKTRR
jgi:hypothetical protein